MNGTDYLAEFRKTRAEKAFGELVRRYADLVFSVARRRVGNVTLAEEVSQMVFIRLSKAPPKLESEGQLLGWLHRTTVHVSIDLWRSETRRHAREQLAAAMQSDHTEEETWNEMVPVLDEALDGLDESDREILLLRFFEQKTMADLGRMFDVSEDAAKMRVSRALERLRKKVGGLGVTCGAALLGTLLYERSVEAAPQGLAGTLSAIRIVAPAGVAGGLAGLLVKAGALMKTAPAMVTAVIVVGVGSLLIPSVYHHLRHDASESALKGANNGSGTSNVLVATAGTKTNSVGKAGDPDPMKLLQGVIRARQRITSGIVEFEVQTFGSVTRARDTNQYQLKIKFEDSRQWIETFGREYAYNTPIPGGPEAEAIIKRADQMSREEAVREGLLEPFSSHCVAYYDGEFETVYKETQKGTNPPSGYANIRRSGEGSAPIFDPRCLGITTAIFRSWRLGNGHEYKQSKAVLLGKESVEGGVAWHVRVSARSGEGSKFDYWLDVENPTHVLKFEDGTGRIAFARYSESDPMDPLPIESRHLDYRDGVLRYEQCYFRRSASYNVPIDPACWTLEGLRMKIGTDVSDSRIMRRIGYWTGTGLSENLPREGRQQHEDAPIRAEMLSLLNYDPGSAAGLGAALWIMTNSPDGPDLQKAANVILASHIQSQEMRTLAVELERMRPLCSSNLLRAMMNENPAREIRGRACLALATLRKAAAGYGSNAVVTAEAERLYERVIN